MQNENVENKKEYRKCLKKKFVASLKTLLVICKHLALGVKKIRISMNLTLSQVETDAHNFLFHFCTFFSTKSV